jgi:hypothetical protein
MSNKRLLFGLFFVCGALLCGLVTLYAAFRAASRVRRLTPVTAVALEGTRTGDDVLIEGRVSDRNPVRSQGFVAYVLEWREIDEEGEPGSWSVSARMTPPLLLELPDGLVQVGNDDYELEDAHTIEEEEAFDEPSTVRYKGIAVGDPVLAVGVAVGGSEHPQIEADFIARGTRAEYVARRRRGGAIFCVFSIVVAAAGGVVLLWDRIAGWLALRR